MPRSPIFSISFLLNVASVVDLSSSAQLNSWKNSLTNDPDITPRSLLTATPHKLMLHLVFWWLLVLLHRPFFHDESQSIHSMIYHVKVRNISFYLVARNYTCSPSVMSSCCRQYDGPAIYLAHSLRTPVLPSYPNYILCWYCVPFYRYAT